MLRTPVHRVLLVLFFLLDGVSTYCTIELVLSFGYVVEIQVGVYFVSGYLPRYGDCVEHSLGVLSFYWDELLVIVLLYCF